MKDRGFIYGQQKMTGMFQCTGDWAIYLEGDEILHEDDLPAIKGNMEQYLDDRETEAFYFDYYHFYGTPNQVGIGGYSASAKDHKEHDSSHRTRGLYFVVQAKNKGSVSQSAPCWWPCSPLRTRPKN